MLTDKQVGIVARFFGVFNPTPAITLDMSQHSEEESYVIIGGWLSIGKVAGDVPSIKGSVPGYTYRVYGNEGEELSANRDFVFAIGEAMRFYTHHLWLCVEDQIVCDALAEDLATNK